MARATELVATSRCTSRDNFARWNPVIKRLAHRRFEVTAVANPLRSVQVDAAYVHDVISAIGRPVVLVGHSYGGMVITEAAADNDAVVGLTYVAAFAPEHGESAFELSGKFPGSTLAAALVAHPLYTGGNELTIAKASFHQQFAADVPAATAAVMASTQRPITEVALTTGLPTHNPAWRSIPSWFVFGSDDRNIPAELIRFMAERAGSRGMHEVTGASPALSVSCPDAVAAMIMRAADAASSSTASPLRGTRPSRSWRAPLRSPAEHVGAIGSRFVADLEWPAEPARPAAVTTAAAVRS